MTRSMTWPTAGGSLLMGAALVLAGCPMDGHPPSHTPTTAPGDVSATEYQPRDYFYPASATQRNVLLLTSTVDLPGTMTDEVATASLTSEVTAYGANTAEVRTTNSFTLPGTGGSSPVASSSVSTASFRVEADGTVVVTMDEGIERYPRGVFTSAGAIIGGQGGGVIRMSLEGGPEAVQVPAGPFSALRFTIRTIDGDYRSWYARQVGSVRTDSTGTFSVVVGTPPATSSAVATVSTRVELVSRTP